MYCPPHPGHPPPARFSDATPARHPDAGLCPSSAKCLVSGTSGRRQLAILLFPHSLSPFFEHRCYFPAYLSATFQSNALESSNLNRNDFILMHYIYCIVIMLVPISGLGDLAALATSPVNFLFWYFAVFWAWDEEPSAAGTLKGNRRDTFLES
ncbi:hypothetical protein DFH08DRAFT_944802 [Mycena albidolilacea]|uniref:Uncharacterized protein n=1 Tax=Mycena albidolilacea TaxID=1033008 RepID=A0AAD7EAU2_9AGAR|nr:hypothetical protein DFH08DRAFT_944802 [Mycena albidolilacea]